MINNKKLKEYWEFYQFTLENPNCSREGIIAHLRESTEGSVSVATFDRLKKDLRELGLALIHQKSEGYFINESKSAEFKKRAAFIQVINHVGIVEKKPNELKQMLKYIHANESAFKGNENLEFLIQCCVKANEIQFNHYHYQKKVAKTKNVHPYQIREHQGRWYIIGLDADSPKFGLISFGIDRITDLKTTGKNFERDKKINPDEYYRNVIGMFSSKKKPETIILSTDESTWNYFNALPWHHSQELIDIVDGRAEFQLTVSITPDLVKEIVRWSPNIKVIMPASLKRKVIAVLEKGLALYN